MKRIQQFMAAGLLAAALAGVSAPGNATLTNPNGPLFVGVSVAPLVMLDITKDQNLYKKAFSDASDLDGDGILDTTYKHTIDYYGYFDSDKCYTYSSTNGYFSPVAASYTEDSNGNPIKPADCAGNWHGNFLNWASMTRMDAVRKLLYGGYRSTDGTGASGTTVLERAYIPTDAHAFAKYYNPDIASVLDPVIQQTFPYTVAGTTYATAAAYTAANYLPLNKLTPFNPATTPTGVTSTTSNTVALGTHTFTIASSATGQFSYGDQVMIEDTTSASSTSYMIGAVSCVNGTGISMYNSVYSSGSCAANTIQVVVENAVAASGTTSSSNWKISDWTQTGMTICNATLGATSGVNQKSQTNTNPPLLRVALGDFSMWAANERWQCYWREESIATQGEVTTSVSGATSTQGNRAALSGLYASSIGPNKTTTSAGRVANGANGSSSDYIARVQACVSGALGQENCELYPSGDYKPNGLLQTYGEAGLLKFGLMTGSYTKNESGGVLRKNLGSIANEINTTTDGTFVTTLPSGGTIINTLNKMRIYGYNYGDGTYAVDGTNGSTFCSWGQQTFSEGSCLSWGNPMSEVFLESLRYFAGKTATTSFNADDSSILSGLTTATWSDPISLANYCAPLNVLVFNASTSSYDARLSGTDQMGGITDLGSSSSAATLTDTIGTNEGITGGTWFVGNSDGTNNSAVCSAKTISNFSNVVGICPEGPATEGGFLMSGVAFYAHTNRIRNDSGFSIPTTDTQSLKVNTYGIALASNVPQISIKVGSGLINIQPATLNRLSSSTNSTNASGTLVDFEKVCEILQGASDTQVASITKKSAGTCAARGAAAFYVNWEDSAQGGDYDQDLWGRLRYQVNSNSTLTVTTDVVAQSTPYLIGFGYSITGTGTATDGPHFHSGINGFSYTDTSVTATGASDITGGGCNGCVVNDAATSVTYTPATNSVNHLLNDPLWYAAKWGGFDTTKGTVSAITSVTQWDNKNTDGSTTGCTTTGGCDGVPDTYFPVTNPNALETSLDQAFAAMLNTSSASSVATNSTSLQTGSQIFQAKFNSNNWSGEVLAVNLVVSTDPTLNGTLGSVAWDSGGTGNTGNNGNTDNFWGQTPRNIITYGLDTAGGIPFTWSAISGQTNATQKNFLNTNETGTADTKGSQRVGYLRGDLVTNVGTHAGNFRSRFSALGDIVNSSPTYVGVPEAGWAGPTYSTFVQNNLTRSPMLYVGANDGMLHGFSVADGTEKIAYVPNEVYSNLSKYPAQGYSHRYYVDGTPMVNDVQIGTGSSKAWKTYLVGGLNWGGRAYYALDITDPTQFTEANAASLVKWEFSHSIDGDLGYTFMQPTYVPFKGESTQIALMHNGKWALIAGNGYNSDSGKAALFIIFLDHTGTTWTAGTDYVKLVADNTGPSNGLSTPRPYDFDNDGVVDYVYAGDLQGNLWKFDVTSTNPASWAVAFTGSPLFVAKDASGNRQPITTAPTVTPQTAVSGKGGAMIDFGTGQYLQTSDTTSPFAVQSLYGIWDSAANVTLTGRSQLQQQTVTGVVTVGNNQYRTTSANTVSWTTQFGWYMDFPSSATTGERVAYNPILRNDRFVVPTLIPSATPCLAGGTSWLMEIDALTGSRPASTPFDVNNDSKWDSSDYVADPTSSSNPKIPVSGVMPGQSGIITTPTVVQSQNDVTVEYKYASSSTGAVIRTPEKVSGAQTGRITWHEISQ